MAATLVAVQRPIVCANKVGSGGIGEGDLVEYFASLFGSSDYVSFAQGVKLGRNPVEAISAALASPKCSVRRLCFDENNLQDEGAQLIADSLAVNTSLLHLNLRCNDIKALGAECIAIALSKNRTLLELDLCGNHIGFAGAEAIANMLKSNTTLTSLSVQHAHITGPGLDCIASALDINTTLLSLTLRANEIGPSCTPALTRIITRNRLVNLSADMLELRTADAKLIAHALRHNTSLISLGLGENQFGSEGYLHLASALSEKAILRSLSFFAERTKLNLSPECVSCLMSSPCLIDLNLSFVELSPSNVDTLSRALSKNSALLNLELTGIHLGIEGIRSIGEALAVNSTLRSLDIDYIDTVKTHVTLVNDLISANHTLLKVSFKGSLREREVAIVIKIIPFREGLLILGQGLTVGRHVALVKGVPYGLLVFDGEWAYIPICTTVIIGDCSGGAVIGNKRYPEVVEWFRARLIFIGKYKSEGNPACLLPLLPIDLIHQILRK
ncbi:FBox-LRR protein [Pelomyxa schiedti]|nr:FBox-LRR protein [Pelomyxa schiedti]